VQANLLALETDRADYQALNVGTGRPTSVRTVCELLAKGLNLEIEPEIVGKYREGDIRHCVADISKAKSLLGYEPQISFANATDRTAQWLRFSSGISAQAPSDSVRAEHSESIAAPLAI